MRAPPRLDPDDELGIDQDARLQALRVLFRDKVVGDNGDAQAIRVQEREEPLNEPGLARAHRSAHTDPDRAHLLENIERPERDTLHRLTGAELAVDFHPIGLRVDPDLG